MMAATPTASFKWNDAVALAVLVRQPSAIFAPKNSRFKTWQDVVKEAQAKPGTVTLAITGPTTADDLTAKYLASKNVSLVGVPYSKPAERYTAVLGGHADVLYEQLGDVKSFLDGKQLRPIVIFADKRFPAFKDVPTSKELGHDIAISQFRAIVMKAGTDGPRVNAVSAALEKAAATADYKAWLKDQYADEASFIPAAKAVAFMKRELEVMRKYAPKK